jgi:hypothetical protein
MELLVLIRYFLALLLRVVVMAAVAVLLVLVLGVLAVLEVVLAVMVQPQGELLHQVRVVLAAQKLLVLAVLVVAVQVLLAEPPMVMVEHIAAV